MQTYVFIQIAGIPKGPEAIFTLQRLESGMGANVNLQTIFAGIHFATVNAKMTLLGGTHVTDNGFNLGCCI